MIRKVLTEVLSPVLSCPLSLIRVVLSGHEKCAPFHTPIPTEQET